MVAKVIVPINLQKRIRKPYLVPVYNVEVSRKGAEFAKKNLAFLASLRDIFVITMTKKTDSIYYNDVYYLSTLCKNFYFML